MLVLERKYGQSLVFTIPPSHKERTIEVLIEESSRNVNAAKVVIDVDRSIRVLRKELLEK